MTLDAKALWRRDEEKLVSLIIINPIGSIRNVPLRIGIEGDPSFILLKSVTTERLWWIE